jgi:hypothetical protein
MARVVILFIGVLCASTSTHQHRPLSLFIITLIHLQLVLEYHYSSFNSLVVTLRRHPPGSTLTHSCFDVF